MGGYSVERSVTVNAPSHRVHGMVDDFHNWPLWSPWEELDPNLQRTYTGPGQGCRRPLRVDGQTAGPARAAWRSRDRRRRASRSPIEFLKAFHAINQTRRSLEPSGSGTRVRWVMTGEHKGLMGVFGRMMGMAG